MTYTMQVAGLERQLPLCKVTDDLYIGTDRRLRKGAVGLHPRGQLRLHADRRGQVHSPDP